MLFGLRLDRFSLLLGAFEAGIFSLAFLSSQWILSREGAIIAPTEDIFAAVVLPTLVLLLSILALGAYQGEAMQSIRVFRDRLLVGACIGTVVIIAVDHLLLGHGQPLNQILLAVTGSCLVVLMGRSIGWQISSRPRHVRPRAIVLGSRNQAAALWEACGDRIPTKIQHFVSIGASDLEVADTIPFDRVRAMPSDLAAMARAEGVKEIVVALDDRRGSLPSDELLACRMHGIRVVDSVSFLERETGKVDIDTVHPSWLIFSNGFERGVVGAALKRVLDVGLSLGLLIVLLPVLITAAIAVKLDSAGPVFYRQWRVGRNGRPFLIFKFRSMASDAERDGEAQWAIANDPRITRIGRLLRRSRIDEIPQAINVLRGEMSLVGPRPERPEFVTGLAQQIRFYNERHRAKPGLTGWAQVNYHYGASAEDAKEKLKYDLYYLKNENLLLDIYIILQTARIVIFGEGCR
jgi:sugar transferase (PEP-CTERM system associated)